MGKTKEKANENKGFSGTFMILASAVINILLGVVMLFVEQIDLKTLCYIFISLLIICGIGMIIQYLMTEAYKNINQYGLSAGALLVILGMCALVRVDRLSAYFIVWLCIWLLVSGIIKLQYALDLKALKDKTWLFLLIVSATICVCAVLLIINPFTDDTYHTYLTYIMLIADGIISLLSTAYLSLRLKRYHKLSEKRKEEQETMLALAKEMEAEQMQEESGTLIREQESDSIIEETEQSPDETEEDEKQDDKI